MNSLIPIDKNQLLAAIGAEARSELRRTGRIVELRSGDVLRSAGHEAEHLWFPLSGVVSLTIPVEDGASVAAGLVGREGVVGLSSLLDRRAPTDEAVVQLAGEALRVECAMVRKLMQRDPSTMAAMLRYARDLFDLVCRTAACNLRHELLQRLARWILLAQDRSEDSTMPLTQGLLATMLGVQRSSITVAAQKLQQQGAIRYARGRLTVKNRALLEQLACDCYAAARTSGDAGQIFEHRAFKRRAVAILPG